MLALAQESQRSKANALKADKHKEGIFERERNILSQSITESEKLNQHCPALKLKEL